MNRLSLHLWVTLLLLSWPATLGLAAQPPTVEGPPPDLDATPEEEGLDVPVEPVANDDEDMDDEDAALFEEASAADFNIPEPGDSFINDDSMKKKLIWRGYIESDFRFTPEKDVDFLRTESTASSRLSALFGRHVAAVADARFVYTERSEAVDFAGLTNRSLLDPWRLESDELFVEFRDVGVDGLDIRLGRQVVIWGSADRFHPTSNLNPLDVEDPLQFGAAVGNQMLLVRWRPDAMAGEAENPWFDEFNLELVCVPVFKPAQLPESAGFAFTDQDELERRATSPVLKELIDEQKLKMQQGWTFAYEPTVQLPESNLQNAMAGARMSFRLMGVDLGFSYFRGFDDFPRAEKVTNETLGLDVTSRVQLTYPRVQVIGADMATSLGFLGGMGLWAEVGMTFHDDLYRLIDTFPLDSGVVSEKEHSAGHFIKAVVGMDYSITPWWYVNVQYMHGFLDEFGADQLKHYIVAGSDIKMARDKVLLRFFGIVSLEDQSFVLFPQVVLKPWNNGEFAVGSFLFMGESDTKFGSPAAGRSNVFLKGRVSF